MNERIIYFSLNAKRKWSFYKYLQEQRICYEQKFSFSLEGENVVFNDPRDLIVLIERSTNKDSLHIIIDYVSCCGTGNEKNYSEVIRDIIMCYPEVQFLFDETFVRKSEDKRKKRFNYLNFLFWKVGVEDVASEVLVGFHQFELKFDDPADIKSQFIRLLKGCNNMFDGSNLRHAIKMHKFGILDVEPNYKKLQKSRCDHAAVVVEEEYHQNMFNSYCLYANGFRVVPIISATELLWINQTIEEGKVKSLEPPLLIRDYDLQFVDENRVKTDVKKGKKTINTDSSLPGSSLKDKKVLLNEIDYIRGAKFFAPVDEQDRSQIKEKEWRIIETKYKTRKGDNEVPEDSVVDAEVTLMPLKNRENEVAEDSQSLKDGSETKSRLEKKECRIIEKNKSKKGENEIPEDSGVETKVRLVPLKNRENEVTEDSQSLEYGHWTKTQRKEKKIHDIETKQTNKEPAKDAIVVTKILSIGRNNPYWIAFQEDKTYFVSKGDPAIEINLSFPYSMVTDDGKTLKLRGLKKPLKGIYASLKMIDCVDKRYSDSRESDPFKITRGDNSGHSIPLDLYGVTRSMVRRAEEYLKTGDNRLAALVAGEALEVLNGFHKSLMNKAYYIQAVAENAMAASLLGGDEDILRKDVKFRLKQKVRKDVERMIPDEEDRYNLLYNIYNDCMLFCQKKEYYDAADEALSIMVIEKDGWHYKDCWKSIKEWFEDCWKSIKKWFATKFKQEKKNTN